MPFVTTEDGRIAWESNCDDQFPQRVLPSELANQGVLRLTEFQSCCIDARGLPLPDGYSGGFGVATIPKTSHSLQNVEVMAKEWDAWPSRTSAPAAPRRNPTATAADRGSLATDYIVSGAHIIGGASNRKRDSVLAIMNIEFEDEQTGTP